MLLRMLKFIEYPVISLYAVLFLIIPLFAIEINKVVLVGNTVDIGADDVIADTSGDFSKEEIEALGVKITDEYHRRGFTTTYVERLVVNKNGILKIHVRESKIVGLNVSGIDGKEKEEIRQLILPEENEIYNRFVLEKRAEYIKEKYNLDYVKLYPVNYEDTGDVYLTVKTERAGKGDFYGGIGVEPIYGITPELGYIYPFDHSGVNLFARAGYWDGELRRVEGDLKFFMFIDEKTFSVYAGSGSARLIEKWMSRDSEYKTLSISPVAGCRYVYGYLFADFNVSEIITGINDYNYKEEKFTDYDTRFTIDAYFSNQKTKLNPRDVSGVKVIVSGGRSDLADKGYLISSCRMKGVLSPYSGLRFIPRGNIYYTTSSERFHWSYVYNVDLLGFPEDYTASKWKNVAALDIEYEVSPDFLFMGPFVNSGIFLDEDEEWKRKSGGGLKAQAIYKKVAIDVYFAWDLSKGYSDGGLYILAGGRF